MKNVRKILATVSVLLTLAFGQLSYGQYEVMPDNFTRASWIMDEGIWSEGFLYLRNDRFSAADFDQFKAKILAIRDSPKTSPWEGIYRDGLTDLGKTEFRLSFEGGFTQFYVYSCQPELRWLNFGRALDTGDTITLSSDFNSSPKSESVNKLVKVKWGDRQYLVLESSLSAFAEKVAGLWVEPSSMKDITFQKWSGYWAKGIVDEPTKGFPQFPEKYSSLERRPIEGSVTFVGKSIREKEFQLSSANSTHSYYNANIYSIRIDKGSRSGAKPGMIFDVLGSDDSILIKSVSRASSVGILIRSIGEGGSEECVSESGETAKCKSLQPGSKVSTQIGKF